MPKVLSARVDESAIDELERTAHQLGISKKQFLEEAIRLRARQAEREGVKDVWSVTLGAWKRRESAKTTVRAARKAFNDSFRRHHSK
jgi:hypothetical protein